MWMKPGSDQLKETWMTLAETSLLLLLEEKLCCSEFLQLKQNFVKEQWLQVTRRPPRSGRVETKQNIKRQFSHQKRRRGGSSRAVSMHREQPACWIIHGQQEAEGQLNKSCPQLHQQRTPASSTQTQHELWLILSAVHGQFHALILLIFNNYWPLMHFMFLTYSLLCCYRSQMCCSSYAMTINLTN